MGNASFFKVGDRVRMHVANSKYTGELGTIKVLGFEKYIGHRLSVQFDCNEEGHLVTFPVSYFELETEYEGKSIQQQRGEDIAAYSEWFKNTYHSVESAGGDPIRFIDRLPPDIIDTMIRNNLYIEYKK